MISRVSATIAVSLMQLAACSTSERAADTTGGSGSADSATVAPNVVTYNATNYKFTGPSEIPAGMTTFRLVNDGPGIHHLQIVRFDSGKTLADFKAIKPGAPPPAWLALVGGPNAPNPGMEANATVDMPPGNYALVCFVDMPEKMPHVAKGMVLPLTVKNGAGPAAKPPTADVVVTLFDYNFKLSKPLAAGRQTIEVRTEMGQPHEIELIRLAPGKTADDMLGWMQKMSGPPPGEALGGVAAVAGGGAPNYFSADLTPGNYMLICFVPDAKDGKPHFAKGMMQVVTIT